MNITECMGMCGDKRTHVSLALPITANISDNIPDDMAALCTPDSVVHLLIDLHRHRQFLVGILACSPHNAADVGGIRNAAG